ncbi:MAG: thioesterase family protein [Deltaproteobacteria bacterium]|nr:thioesterase family protein [Deltaproteobacteria bacterium]
MSAPSRVSHPIRVIYGDTDQMGVVYYANYFRFFEVGRNELCRAREIPYREVEAEGFILPVVEAQARYQEPARYDDLLRLDTWVSSVGRVQLRFDYELYRSADDTLLVSGHTVHACLGEGGRLRRLPDRLRAALLTARGE